MYLVISVVKNNRKQSKLFHWDQRKQFVISDILLYQISLYRVSTACSPYLQENDRSREEEAEGRVREPEGARVRACGNRRRNCQLSHYNV